VRPRHLTAIAATGLVVLLAGGLYSAYTASATVASGNAGMKESAVVANDLKPSECTMTVTSILSGSGTFTATAQYQLVLGSGAADTVTLQKNDCFIGGGPKTGGTYDHVTGPAPGGTNGDQCVVTANATVKRCTIVATRP
jgi:hypothetical protein